MRWKKRWIKISLEVSNLEVSKASSNHGCLLSSRSSE
jgi:hypothetical protein